jgi:hypothetical protein
LYRACGSLFWLLDQQFPAAVYPVAAGNALTVAVMSHFLYLVTVPLVMNLFPRLLTAFAYTPSDLVVLIVGVASPNQPAYYIKCGDCLNNHL